MDYLEPLVPAVLPTSAFQNVVQNDIRCKLGPLKFMTCLLPIVGSPFALYLNILCAACAVIFYVVCALVPPDWILHASEEFHFPEWMCRVLGGFLACASFDGLVKTCLARNMLLNEDVSIMLNDPEMIRKFVKPAKENRAAFTLYGLLCCILFSITALCGFRNGLLLHMPLFISPCFALAFSHGVPFHAFMEKLVELSWFKVEAFCSKLEARSTTEESVPNQMNDANFWGELTRQHLKLDKELERLWRLDHGGALLLIDVASKLSLQLVLAMFAVGAERRDVIISCVALASGSFSMLLKSLYPMAQVTSLCQSKAANTKSIPRLAVEFVNHGDFTCEAQAAHSRFLQYVLGTPAGIEMPLMGLITQGRLVTYAKGAATLAPALLTYLLRTINHEGVR